MIAVIDYGSSNIASITNALDYLSQDYSLVNNGDEMKNFHKFILPGVGSFKHAMQNLSEKKFIEPIKDIINFPNKSILGICLGMQLFYSWSEEDNGCAGMDIIKGNVKRIDNNKLPVPNTGWRQCTFTSRSGELFKNIDDNSLFYFVHSFGCHAHDKNIVTSEILYTDQIDASFNYKNLYGTQFHPEKSQSVGLSLLKNFIYI